MSTSLEGRVAIVTGSSRGIGAAIVQQFAAHGARVVVNYRQNSQAADEVVNAINSKREGTAIAVMADASTKLGGEQLLEACMRMFGKVDILVLNAGVGPIGIMHDLEESVFESTFNLHVKGPVFLTRAVAAHLPAGGRIIFVSSYITKKSTVMPFGLIQASSKGAIDQVARVLAKDLGPRQITVNTVSPGPIDTALLREGVSEHKLQFIAKIHPQKRLGMPADVAPLVAFLAGPDGAWINGQNIHVNGGLVV